MTIGIEKRGNTFYLYHNGELKNTYVEPDETPDALFGVHIRSGWISTTQYDYISVDVSTRLLSATIDIDPDTLNLRSRGRWITCYIEFPEGYSVSDIDRTTILLNDAIPVDPFWVDKPVESVVGDYDEDGIPDLMVKFDRASVIAYIMDNIDWSNPERTKPLTYKVTLTVTGNLYDGTPFKGSDITRVLKFLKDDPMPL